MVILMVRGLGKHSIIIVIRIILGMAIVGFSRRGRELMIENLPKR